MNFHKYQHIERLGTDGVDGILLGKVHVFPKLDGANVQMWMEQGEICCGTRNNKLAYADSSGWSKLWDYVHSHAGIRAFFKDHPELRLYAEWLIPHTLKTYIKSAWNKAYVFDVVKNDAECLSYLSYDDYKPMMEQYGIEYIPCVAMVEGGIPEVFDKLVTENTYLIDEGKGIGEGLVIKRYDFVNKFGRTVWAKRVTNEFKYNHAAAMGAPTLNGGACIEEVIVNQYVTLEFIEKEYCKIIDAKGGWKSEYIPMLLGVVYHTLIVEELWQALKKYKSHQTINFRTLNQLTTLKVKELKLELF